ncbi:MAG: pilus assembly protein TadG-related protein [Deltaproteobacteria bacterium]
MRKRDRGQVIVVFALALFVLLGFAALGIDVAFMYSVRHELQRCADSGALAGASAFFDGDWASDPTRAEADARARVFASRDNVVTSSLDPLSEVSVDFPAPDRIRVTTQRTVNLFFARVLGRPTQFINASATAEAAVADTGVKCLKPWGIPLPWDDFSLNTPETDNNLKYDFGEHVYSIDDMPAGYKVILKVGEPFNNPNNLDNLSSLQQESGHFFALSLCDDSGGSDYRNRISDNCYDDCAIDNNTPVDLKTGNTVGPTRQGVDQLIAQDPDAELVEGSDPVTVVGSRWGTDWINSSRVVKIPLYDPSEMLRQGNTEMTVVGFAGFWLKGYDTAQGTVIGYYIPSVAIGASSTTGPSNGPVLRTLRLVE